MIYHIEHTTSTNDDARDKKYRHADIIWAEHQSDGRGQRGNKWQSGEGKNLTFSMVVEPHFLPATEQFRLLEVISLALVATLIEFGIEARIKWTNDIYVGDKKIAGVLIEHNYAGNNLSRTIIGIGLNINQDLFNPELPNPVSMRQITGIEYNRGDILKLFYKKFTSLYIDLERGNCDRLEKEYVANMYRLMAAHPFRFPDGTITEAIIEGVRPTGELILRHTDGTRGEYLFKEIEFWGI